jgi:hypothetical protein
VQRSVKGAAISVYKGTLCSVVVKALRYGFIMGPGVA